jgi:septal ring-binding cell division protein DamX
MTQAYNSRSRFYFRRKLSGPALLGIGFVTGAVCAGVAVYQLHPPRGSAPPGVAEQASSGLTPRLAVADVARDGTARIGPRMTYELSRPPAEKAAGSSTQKARASSPAIPSSAASVAVPQRSSGRSLDEPAVKVANARPIYATPPEPRDTTREIEKESLRPYREPARQQRQASTVPTQPRIVEGRDFVLPPKKPTGKTSTERRAQAAGAASDAESPVRSSSDRAERARATSAKAALAARSMSGDSARATPADVETRLAATREWLRSAAPSTHTIQILGASNDDQLRAQLKTLAGVLEPSKVYLFRTRAQGKPSVTLVYGAYADRSAALAALAKLPDAAAASRPVVRTVKGIRAEILQHQAGS